MGSYGANGDGDSESDKSYVTPNPPNQKDVSSLPV